ncbi:MAG: putative lipid II flippase FtsW [Candidatus Riflebacteria bacterium]|nr:putative lipid II flippase FtsW [Candidatus Riflebacteria bacterium]
MLNVNKERHFDNTLLFVTLALMCFGLIMVYSASSITSMSYMNDSLFYFKKQLLWVGIAIVGMFIASNYHYRRLEKYSVPLILLSVVFLIAVYFTAKVGGAHRWLRIGGLGFQPSEFAKIAFIIYIAHSISIRQDRIQEILRGIVPDLLVMLVIFGLILKEPNLSTAGIVASTYFLMLFLGNGSLLHLLGIGAGGAIAVTALVFQEGYRMRRFLAFLDPWGASKTAGYHIIQSLVAIGSGGFWGLGLSQSRQKFFILPERHTDFIFAIICEELGFIGGGAVILLFLLLIWRGFYIAARAPDLFGFLLAAGLTCLIACQTLINLGVVLSVIPTTGVTLPFISYGGSSVCFMAVAIGILLNISRYGTIQNAIVENRKRPFSSRYSDVSERVTARRKRQST